MFINFLDENIHWLRGIFSIIFSGTATTIGILTYLRAKENILQPIRSEVIKKQSKLLTEILEYLSHNKLKKLDYINISIINAYKVLLEYGFILSDNDKIIDKINEDIDGWIYCGESNKLESVEVITPFLTNEGGKNEKVGAQKYKVLKEEGKAKINKIYITKTHSDFIDKITYYANSAFLPETIKNVINKFLKEVNINLTEHMKIILEEFIEDFGEEYFKNKAKKDVYNNIAPLGVYNNFNHKRIHHKENFKELKKEIRKYLKIESMP